MGENVVNREPLKVEYRPLDRLIPYAGNARVHSPRQVTEISDSIMEFGFSVPILVDDDGVIIAGHGRLLAARQLGMKLVPVIVLHGLSPQQRKALALADNQIALNAEWDDEALRRELNDLLNDTEYPIDPATLGFDEEELRGLLEIDEAHGEIPLEAGKDRSNPGKGSLYLRFGKIKVPLSQVEHDELERLLDKYASKTGGRYGFAGCLMRGEIDE